MMSVDEPTSGPTHSVHRIEIDGCQDVRVACELQQRLLELAGSPESHCLELTATASIDATTMQLLLAAKREMSDRLVITVPPDSDTHAWLRRAGLESELLDSGVAAEAMGRRPSAE